MEHLNRQKYDHKSGNLNNIILYSEPLYRRPTWAIFLFFVGSEKNQAAKVKILTSEIKILQLKVKFSMAIFKIFKFKLFMVGDKSKFLLSVSNF